MARQNYKQIISEIEKGKIAPVYFLSGEESFFGKKIEESLLKNIVPAEAASFDQMIVYAQDMPLHQLLMRAGQFPMMNEKQLLVVRNAELYFKKEAELKEMSAYLKNPPAHTVLSFRYSGKPGAKIKKVFQQSHVLFYESPRIYENQIPSLIDDLLKYHGFSSEPKSLAMLSEFVGTDLNRMEKEVEKLSVVLETGTRITPDLVEKYVGISKEFNIFEFKNAIVTGKPGKAFKIARYFSYNPKEFSMHAIVAVLFGFFSQLYKYHNLADKTNRKAVASALGINPYFVSEYQQAARFYPMKKISRVISVLRETDLKVKGLHAGRAEYRDLIDEMLYKIMS